MSRSLIIGLIITVAIIVGLATFFYNSFIKVKNTRAVDAVPNDAAVIFEVKNIQQTWASFYATDMWKDLKQNESIKVLNTFMVAVDSLVQTNDDIQSMFADNRTSVSLHAYGAMINTLLVIESGSYKDEEGFIKWVCSSTNGRAIKRVFDKEIIYEILNKEQHAMLSVAFRNHLFIISEDGTLVEESIRKLKYNITKQGRGFEQGKSFSDLGSDMNVYVNYQVLPLLLATFNKDEYKEIFTFIKTVANWSLFNVELDQEHIGISGVTYTDDSLFQFLDLFKTQSPMAVDLSKYIPVNSAYTLQFNFSNYTQFNSDLVEYLQNTGKLESYIAYSDSIEERYNISIADKLTSQIGGTSLLGIHEGNGQDFMQQVFALLTFKNNTAVLDIFNSYTKAFDKRGEADSIQINYNGFSIKRLPLGNIFKLFYGQTFEPLHSPFYVLYDDVFIMANSLNTLKLIIDELETKNTLALNESYKMHSKSSATSSNISLFLSPAKCFQFPSIYANEIFISALNRFSYDFKKFEFIDIQYANSANNSFFTSVNFKFNPSFKSESNVLWMTQLDTTFSMQPSIVYNSSLKQPCIFVQDLNNTLYYINNSGSILWRTKLSGKINSQFFEVDVNKNGEISYLFSTNKQACLVSSSGNNITGYPVRFPGTATAGINLFDFYKDSNYQYFVPLENNKVMGYSLNGKSIQGWNPKSVDAKITTRLGGFTLANGPFICGSAANKKLLIYGLKPSQIKQTDFPVASSLYPAYTFSNDTQQATIWVTDTLGNLVMLSIKNDLSSEIKQLINTDSTDLYHLVFATQQGQMALVANNKRFSLFTNEGKKVLTKVYTDSVTTLPFISYTKEKNAMLGYTECSLGKVNWLDFKGTLYPSFPLEGNTPFVTGNLLLNNANYLVCGNKNNNLVMYRLK